MFEIFKKNLISKTDLETVGGAIYEEVAVQLGMASYLEDCQGITKKLLENGYLIGYLLGFSTVFGAYACRKNNINDEHVGENATRIFNHVVTEAFGQELVKTFERYAILFMQKEEGEYDKGYKDAELDIRAKNDYGKYLQLLYIKFTKEANEKSSHGQNKEEGSDAVDLLPSEVEQILSNKTDAMHRAIYEWINEQGSVDTVKAAIAQFGDEPNFQALTVQKACEFANKCEEGSGARLFAMLML